MGYSLHLSLKNIENLQRSSDFSHLIMHNLASLACFQMRFFLSGSVCLKVDASFISDQWRTCI